QIALQPLLGRCIPTPAGQIRGDIDLLPFRMMTGLKQRLESGEEHINKIRHIAISLRHQSEFGNGEYAADRDRSDWLALLYESGVIRRGQYGGQVDVPGGRAEGDVDQVQGRVHEIPQPRGRVGGERWA